MKTALYIIVRMIAVLIPLSGCLQAQSQGRVLINEYLPWPNNACGTTAEFIELLNFGPGPVNIGCYVVTDGDYSITIPPNTILAPGAFYVLSGQDIIPQDCGNDLRNVTVNLNWNTCGCTSGPIPTTGDGLMTDGGSANEQVVLLNPAMQVVDAVVRALPVESSAAITTSASGGCTSRSFNLDTMAISYETIGQSTGRGNSMARRTDGGCAWIKDTQESAGDPNNTGGLLSELDASLTVLNSLTCTNTGSAVASVLSGNLAQIFPVNYILAKDTDSNLVFTATDSYLYGTDSTASTVPVSGLTPGRYKLQLQPASGCDDAMFDFIIFPCNLGLLQVSGTQSPSPQTTKGQGMKVYPNPFAGDQVTMSIHAAHAGSDVIQVIDVIGRVHQVIPIHVKQGVNNLLLTLPNLAPGTWYLCLQSSAFRPVCLTKVKN